MLLYTPVLNEAFCAYYKAQRNIFQTRLMVWCPVVYLKNQLPALLNPPVHGMCLLKITGRMHTPESPDAGTASLISNI